MRKNSVTSAKEELLARLEGRLPVRGSDGREYYVRYNDNREELEEVPPPELRPLTEKDKAETARLSSGLRPQGFGALEIAGEGLKGFGQGVVSGLGRVAGGATLGATDWLDRKAGSHLASLDADLQRSAESAGLGGWNKTAKFASELGGNMLFGGMAGKKAFETARPFYNAYQIGRAYDRLRKDPFQGSGRDIIARMKNHNGETVMLQRGEVLKKDDGSIIASGKSLGRVTGTERNYGLNKAIYKHDVPREQVTRIPKTIKGKPVETTDLGQDVYMYKARDGNYRVVTSSTPKGKTVSSMYKIER
jgi:hypothetical protein